MKTVIICAHGLIKDAPHDFFSFRKYVDENNLDLEVDLIKLYDVGDRKSFRFSRMKKVLEERISYYQNQGYRIILLGYSFSCGLCAKMCKNFKIAKLIIVAPVLKIFHKGGMQYFFKMVTKSFKLRFKAAFDKKRRKSMKKKNSLYFFDLLVSCFLQLGKTKHSYRNINCSTLCMLGREDTLIHSNHVSYIRKQVNVDYSFDQRFYSGADHVFIMSSLIDKSKYYQDIISFVM